MSEELTQSEGDAYGALGDRIVRVAVMKMLVSLKKQKAHAFAPFIASFGMVRAVGDFVRANTDPSKITQAELIAIAYLRGAIRDAGGPVHEDGRPFTGLFDA